MKKVKLISKTTDNRRVYSVYRKQLLESQRLIDCSRCPYHKVENYEGRYYGGRVDGKHQITYPNWKLVSKNSKQWMDKPMKKIIDINYRYEYEYVEFQF